MPFFFLLLCILLKINIPFFCCTCYVFIFFFCFEDFLFITSFQQIVIYLGFLCLSRLVFVKLLGYGGFCFSSDTKNLVAIIFTDFFLRKKKPHTFSQIQIALMLDCTILTHRALRLCSLFFSFFSLASFWIKSIDIRLLFLWSFLWSNLLNISN